MSTVEITQSLIDAYYEASDPEELEALRGNIQNNHTKISLRKEEYIKNKDKFAKLKNIFKELIIERNKLAKASGFSNYFDFVSDWYDIPTKSWGNFDDNYQKLSKSIISQIPQYKNVEEEYWTEFNNPVASSLIVDEIEYKLPNVVYTFFTKKHPNFNEIQKRIKLVEDQNRYFYTDYNLENKSVEVKGNLSSKTSASAIAFAQEVGHAIQFVKLMDRGIDPDSKSSYWHEKAAIKEELKFEETLEKEIINANRDRVLYHYTLTLFEKSIYENPTQDFDTAFAVAHNNVYPSKQTSNPFYILNYFLIDMPGYSAIYSAVYTELLSKVY